MKKVINLIAGAILATVGMAAFNGISDIICGATELAKARITIEIIKANNEIEKLQEGKPPETRAIGFATNSKEDEENG